MLKKIKVNDIVIILAALPKPPAKGFIYFDHLNERQCQCLYILTQVDDKEKTCGIEPIDKTKRSYENFDQDHLVVVKYERPKINPEIFS